MEDIEYASWTTDEVSSAPPALYTLDTHVSGGLDQNHLESLQVPPHLQGAVNQARNPTPQQMQPTQQPQVSEAPSPTPNPTHSASTTGPTNFAELTPEQNTKLLELHYAPSDAKFVETQLTRDILAVVALVSFIILAVLLVYYMVVQSRINKLDASIAPK